ncbi:DNA cytosine methyltransferase [Coleofasciculus sp. FACHB-129]|uniref:DNA cytosine methyltransferase n=1 Tax=Cyanophyceae TaxID=3028117 RepID=UPI00168675E4|nr:DNA cytosine methyltransferase [Coleofasciculus sp. FACHB-129]MBD1895535.1 DNA cytosine methyltransferase [Coleofasciculus sp. FACHB-129]
MHASPVCSNFSNALGNGTDQSVDREAATAVSQWLRQSQPKCFTLENVSRYRQSESWQIIQDELIGLGYQITAGVLDAADYGVSQSRKRLIVKAARGKALGLPPGQSRVGWYPFVQVNLRSAFDAVRSMHRKLFVLPIKMGSTKTAITTEE